MNSIQLPGCRPEPLASYLKALGILRLLVEQRKDPGLKVFWDGTTFSLKTALTADEIVQFFVNEYQPTPIVSPWNGGSGFSPNDNQDALKKILGSTESRLDPYREVIRNVQTWPEIPRSPDSLGALADVFRNELGRLKAGKKRTLYEKHLEVVSTLPKSLSSAGTLPLEQVEALAKKGDPTSKKWWGSVKKARSEILKNARGAGKETLLQTCRARLPESALMWFDAACSIRSGNTPAFNPLLGSGGNEGRLDFSNNFMQQVVELIFRKSQAERASLLRASLFQEPVTGMITASIGQFDPGNAGGFNQGNGVETKDFKINPWDFVLMIEGSLVFASAVVKRCAADPSAQLSSPFTVRQSNVGFSSSAQQEQGRGELWLPMWSAPAGLPEILQLFREGRAQVGRKPARTGLDFTRAVGTLGVSRGISTFTRYSFLERRGKSYVALPAGRIPVHLRPVLHYLEELDPLLRQFDQFLRLFPNIPARLTSLRRRIDQRTFDCCLDPSPSQFRTLLSTLGEVERELAQRDRAKKPVLQKPLSGLSPKWVSLCDDGSIEVRLAAALASIRVTGGVGPIRSNLSGVDPAKPWQWDVGSGQKFWFGSNIAERLGGVLARRFLDAEKTSTQEIPLDGRLGVSSAEVMSFIRGETDDQVVEDSLWGFMLIDWSKGGLNEIRAEWRKKGLDSPVSATYAILKLFFTGRNIQGKKVRDEPRLVPLLKAGKVQDAVATAFRRLKVSDLKPIPFDPDTTLSSTRLLAGLVIPVDGTRGLEHLVLSK